MIYGGQPENSLEDLQTYVDQSVETLKPHTDAFDFIACSGMSGVVVAAPLGLQLHKPVVVVRKADDNNGHHAGGEIITVDRARGPYVIVDDFMSSGGTVDYIKQKLSEVTEYHWAGFTRHPQNPPVFAGYYLYAYDSLSLVPAEALQPQADPSEPDAPTEKLDALEDGYKAVRDAVRKYYSDKPPELTYNFNGIL
jgi:hypothetical protein